MTLATLHHTPVDAVAQSQLSGTFTVSHAFLVPQSVTVGRASFSIVTIMSGAPLCAALAQAPAPQAPSALVLRPGDLVRITVWRKPELSGDFLVSADSTLKHPLYREVRVAGLAAAAAREQISNYLKAFETNPQVSIEPLVRVSVGGEVRNPNLYALAPETSISQAVSLAGGPTERGRLDQVQLVRNGQVTILDLSAPDATILATPVASGDRVSVTRQSAVFRDYVPARFSGARRCGLRCSASSFAEARVR